MGNLGLPKTGKEFACMWFRTSYRWLLAKCGLSPERRGYDYEAIQRALNENRQHHTKAAEQREAEIRHWQSESQKQYKAGNDISAARAAAIVDMLMRNVDATETIRRYAPPGASPPPRTESNFLSVLNTKEKVQMSRETYAVALCWPWQSDTNTKARACYDRIANATSRPPNAFDLMLIEGERIKGPIVICFFDTDKGTQRPLSCHAELMPWLEELCPNQDRWEDVEFYGPRDYGLDGYWRGIRVLKQQRIG